jgi:hypothetical protein
VDEFQAVTGTELARILSGDGWEPQNAETCANGFVVLWKDSGNQKPIPLTLGLPIGKNRVEKICRKAGISAAQFRELYLHAPEPDWLAPPPAAPQAERIQ